MRALKSTARGDSIVSRIMGRLHAVRPTASRRLVLTEDLHELKDAVCRLGDGSTGRFDVRESDGTRVVVCIPS